MLESREHHLLARFLDLAGKKNFIEDGVDLIRNTRTGSATTRWFSPASQSPFSYPRNVSHLVKIKNQIQLANIPEETIQHLDEKMNGFQIRELVIVRVDTHAEEQASVTPVNDLRGAELDEVGLMLLISGRD